MDSNFRARLAGFGRTRIIDDDASDDQTKPPAAVERDNRIAEAGDSIRWTAPEMLDPNRFGFTKKLVAKLPSKSTDVYAFGMTILEVSFRTQSGSLLPHNLPPAVGAHRAPPIWQEFGCERREEGDGWSSSG